MMRSMVFWHGTASSSRTVKTSPVWKVRDHGEEAAGPADGPHHAQRHGAPEDAALPVEGLQTWYRTKMPLKDMSMAATVDSSAAEKPKAATKLGSQHEEEVGHAAGAKSMTRCGGSALVDGAVGLQRQEEGGHADGEGR